MSDTHGMQEIATREAASLTIDTTEGEYLLELSKVGVLVWCDPEDLRDLYEVLRVASMQGHLDEREEHPLRDAFRDLVP